MHGPDTFLESVDELPGELNLAGPGLCYFSNKVYARLMIERLIILVDYFYKSSSVNGLRV